LGRHRRAGRGSRSASRRTPGTACSAPRPTHERSHRARTPPAVAAAVRSPRTCRRAWTRARSISSVAETQQLKEAPEMSFELPDLPYAYDALEPHIDAETMRIHHDLHHGAYVTNANAALEGTQLADASVESVLTNLDSLPEDKQTAVRNNAGGHSNHSLFWQIMSPDGGGEPGGALRSAVGGAFGLVPP